MQHLEGSGTPVLYIVRTFLKIDVTSYYRPLFSSFSKLQAERFEQGDVVYGTLLPRTGATFMLLHFCPQEVLCWFH
jgi:hypothetical protein